MLDDHQDDRLQYLRGLTRIQMVEDDAASEIPAISMLDEDDAVPMLSERALLRSFRDYLSIKGFDITDKLLDFSDDVSPLVDALLAGLVGRTAGVTNKAFSKRLRKHAEDVKRAKEIIAEAEFKAAIVKAVRSPYDRPYIIPTEDPNVFYTRSTPQTQWEKDEEAGIPHVYEGPNSTDRNY